MKKLILILCLLLPILAVAQPKKISELTETTTLADVDLFPTVSGGDTKKVTFLNLYNSLRPKFGLATVATSGSYLDLSNRPTSSLSNNTLAKWNSTTNIFENSVITSDAATNVVINSANISIPSTALFSPSVIGFTPNVQFNAGMTANGGTLFSAANILLNGYLEVGDPTGGGNVQALNFVKTIRNINASPTTATHVAIPTERAVRALTDSIRPSALTSENGLSAVSGRYRLGGTFLTGNTDILNVSGSALRFRNIANTGNHYSFGQATFNVGDNAASVVVATQLNGALTVVGNTSLSGASTFTVGTGAVNLGTGALTLGGAITVNNNMTFGATRTLTVGTGATLLGGTLTVTGVTTINNTAAATNFIPNQTSTATAAGTTTLTVSSNNQQVFTGATTQTVVLPVATTLTNGTSFRITNLSTGLVTVRTSGANDIQALASNTVLTVTCINTAGGTGTASWAWQYDRTNPTALNVAIVYVGVPATSTSAGVAGQRARDATYVYECVATNTWVRYAVVAGW